MDRRAFAFGLLGWVVPGIVAVPLVGTRESAGGEAALGMLVVWWGLGVVGCTVGGAAAAVLGRKSGRLADAFKGGLAGVSVAWLGAIAVEVAVETFVRVLHPAGSPSSCRSRSSWATASGSPSPRSSRGRQASGRRPTRRYARRRPLPFTSISPRSSNEYRSRSRPWAPSPTCIWPGMPCDSMRLAELTVSPHRS